MFNSAEQILSKFIKGITRFNIHFVEMYRSENPEDIFYLCQVKDKFYVVYETDYIHSLKSVLNEALDIFPDATFAHWLTTEYTNVELKPEQQEDKHVHDTLVLHLEGTYLRYAVFEVNIADIPKEHYNPTTYGSISS